MGTQFKLTAIKNSVVPSNHDISKDFSYNFFKMTYIFELNKMLFHLK